MFSHDQIVEELSKRQNQMILGEYRGAEAFMMLSAMDSSHHGQIPYLNDPNLQKFFEKKLKESRTKTVVCGGTNTEMTTYLRCVAHKRLLCIEDRPELIKFQNNVEISPEFQKNIQEHIESLIGNPRRYRRYTFSKACWRDSNFLTEDDSISFKELVNDAIRKHPDSIIAGAEMREAKVDCRKKKNKSRR